MKNFVHRQKGTGLDLTLPRLDRERLIRSHRDKGWRRRDFIKVGALFVPTLLTTFRVIDASAGSVIKSRTFSSVQDNRIQLSNSHFARAHGVSSWSKLRIALRFSMNDSGANLTSTPVFAVGLCSGTSNIYGDASVTHFVGLLPISATWTRLTSALCYATNASGGDVTPTKKIGSTETHGTAIGSQTVQIPADVTIAMRWMWFVDILKGTPNYTLSYFAVTSRSTATDVSVADFLTQANLGSPSFAGHGNSGTQTIAVDEATNGTLDCVNISWDRVTPEIELSDLAVVKLS